LVNGRPVRRGIVRFRAPRRRKLVFVYPLYVCLTDRMRGVWGGAFIASSGCRAGHNLERR
jgi:hypothetical protein